MTSVTTKPDLSQPTTESNSHLFDDWFDPIESGIRGRVRELIEQSAYPAPMPMACNTRSNIAARRMLCPPAIARRARRAPGWPESSSGDQANGRREHRGLAHGAR